MGCFSPPGDERLEENEHQNAKTQRNTGKSNPWPPYLFGHLACSFSSVVLVAVLVVEMTSLSTLTFHFGIPSCLWRPVEQDGFSTSD